MQEHLPLVIGGSGERRTLRIVAEHGDIWNTSLGDLDRYKHLVDVLDGYCGDVGRDRTDVRQSLTFRAVLGETEAEAKARAEERFGGPPPEHLRDMYVVGTPEQCVEALRPYVALGAGDFLLGQQAPSTCRRSSWSPSRSRRPFATSCPFSRRPFVSYATIRTTRGSA